MRKCAFIIPYFGKFNNYFPLFLKSCERNYEYDWLIFTDDTTPYNYPKNVIVKYIEFDEFVQIVKSKFEFEISLDRPYKLCDYRPAYGYILEEYLNEYTSWGYCDTDLIFGKLDDFITDNDVEDYDKIGIFGHCTIFKNNHDNNRMFMKSLNGKERYKEVFKSPLNHSFDEEYNESINNIFEQYKKRIKYDIGVANIYRKSSIFKLTNFNLTTKKYGIEKKQRAFFLFDNGILKRYIYIYGHIRVKEYSYIHMQARTMRIDNGVISSDTYKIIPNRFELLEIENIDDITFKNITIKHFNLHYFKHRSKNLYKKVMKRFGFYV